MSFVDAQTITPFASIQLTPTVTNAAYSTGYSVGGLLTFPFAARSDARYGNTGGLVQAAVATIASGATPALDLILFNAIPSASTVADHGTVTISSADAAKVQGVVHLSDASTAGVGIVQGQQAATPFALPKGSTTLYGVLVARSAASLASPTDLTLTISILQN